MYITEQESLSRERMEAALRRVGKDRKEVEALMGTAAQPGLNEAKHGEWPSVSLRE